MKRIVFVSLLTLCFSKVSLAQEIKAYKTFGGVRFQMDTLTLGLNQVLDIVKENPKAYAELKRAKSNYSAAGVLGFTGAVLIGFPIGTAIAGGDPEWGLAAGGAALILASIPFTTAFRGHTMEALDIYNNKSISRIKPEFQFYGNGARLILRF
jgi:hypothetical protein